MTHAPRPSKTTRRRLAFDTALGRCTLEYGAAGIAAVELPSRRPATRGRHLPAARQIARRIAQALDGTPVDFGQVKLDLSGVPPFHALLYATLRGIPWGVTLSYGELAARAGRPGAARAAGRALADCRWSILVPCHRVVASQGLGGYGGPGGLALKRRLLDLEAGASPDAVRAPPPRARPPAAPWPARARRSGDCARGATGTPAPAPA